MNELIQIVAEQIGAFPHGLLHLTRLQNMTNGYFNLERVVVTQQYGYSINSKLLVSSLLARMDRDSDGFVSQADLVYSLINALKYFNITLSPKVDEYLKAYFDIYTSSIQTLLAKYGFNDISMSKIFKIVLI